LNWLSQRQQPGRPFFAFLNYVDAHAPYLLPPDGSYRLGSAPRTDADLRFLVEDWPHADKRRIPEAARLFGFDAYDNCLAYLDDRLGELIDDLERRGVLDQTLVIVTADHGEGLGEHGLFDHGESLYRSEIRVPLVIVSPTGRGRSPRTVAEFVSLRDIATTVADFVRPGTTSPFPGQSLLAFAEGRTSPDAASASPRLNTDDELVLSELASPNPTNPNQGRSPASRGPLISLALGDFVYIRNEGDGNEELFNQREDPNELINYAPAKTTLPVLRRLRDRLMQISARAPGGRGADPAPSIAAAANPPVNHSTR
jgi:arylsulfatase A-like enzyme